MTGAGFIARVSGGNEQDTISDGFIGRVDGGLVKFDESAHPRVSAGSAGGGQFASGGGQGGNTKPQLRAAAGAHAGTWHSGLNPAAVAPRPQGETAAQFNAANRHEAAQYNAAKHRAAVTAANAKLKAARTAAAAEAKKRGLKGTKRTAFIKEHTAKEQAARDAVVHGTSKAYEPSLMKVGPKGYIHGWVFVGAPGVGAHVFHPRHGHGEVSRVDEHGHTHVQFGDGKKRSFETVASTGGSHGGLSRRGEVGGDEFTGHLNSARAANARGDHAAAAEHYRQAAEATAHPAIRVDMQARAARDAGRAEAAGHTPEHNAAVEAYRANNQRKIDRATAERDAAQTQVVRDIRQEQIDRLTERNRNAHQIISGREAKESRRAARVAATPTGAPSRIEQHLNAAEAALRNGDRAAAINHLTAAANATSNRTTRQAIIQRRSDLAAQVMHGTASRRSPSVSPQKARADLRRAEVRAAELEAAYRRHGVPEPEIPQVESVAAARRNVDFQRERVARATAERRQQKDALRQEFEAAQRAAASRAA
jgi:hypothetical protein